MKKAKKAKKRKESKENKEKAKNDDDDYSDEEDLGDFLDKEELDGIDTSLIIRGGRSRRNRAKVNYAEIDGDEEEEY